MVIVMGSSHTAISKKPLSGRKSHKQYSKRFTRSRTGNVFYFIFIAAFGLFCMLPLIYCVATSLKPLDEILIFPPRFFVRRPTSLNYAGLTGLLSNLQIPLSRYIFNSIFISVISTIVYVMISAMAAFALSKGKFKGRHFVFIMIQFALLFNIYTLALPQYLILAQMKMIDTYWVYILPNMAATLGVYLLKQYIEGYIPDTLLEAAKMDGAGYFRIFWQMVMPVIKPAWLTLTLFAFQSFWSFFPASTIFSEQLKTLPMIMTQITAGGVARSGSAMAITVIMMIPPIIIYLVSQSNVIEAMSSAGIKE